MLVTSPTQNVISYFHATENKRFVLNFCKFGKDIKTETYVQYDRNRQK